MRESLTVFAILLVLLLATALVGPYFVDWTAQRSLIEARLAIALGRAVHIGGAIDVKLLPSPRLELQDASLEPAPGQPGFSARTVRLELAPMPLLRGEMRFVDADFDQPQIGVAIGVDGSLVLPLAASGLGHDMAFEHVSLHQASVLLDDALSGQKRTIAPLDLEGEATTLAGPFKGSGQLGLASGALNFRFTTGPVEDGRMRLRAVSGEAGIFPQTDLEGYISAPPDKAGVRQATFEGKASLSGNVRPGGTAVLPWQLSGPVTIDRAGAQSLALELRIGEGDAILTASGSGTLDFVQPPKLTLALVARQLDIDKLRAGEGSATSIADALAAALARPEHFRNLPFSVDVDFSTPVLTLGGQVLPETSARLGLAANRPADLRLTMSLPGRSTLSLDGTVEPGAATGFKGQMQANTRDAARLAEWLDALSPEMAQGLRALPFRQIDIAGLAEISRVNLSGRNLILKLDRSTLNGALAFTRAVGADRARLYADLASEALDLDQMPDLAGALVSSLNLDLALSMDAKAVKVARIGDSMVDAGHIRAKLVRNGASLALEQFALDNLGGASLTARGTWNGASGRVDANLDAARLVDLADLLRRIAPGPATETLAARAVPLSPARITLSLEASTSAKNPLVLKTLGMEGNLGATHMVASLRPGSTDPALMVGALTLEAPETAPLLRQLGLEATTLNGAGHATIAASLTGRPETPMDVKLDATLAGAHIVSKGRLVLDGLSQSGSFRADAANSAPLLRMLGVALPDATGTLPMATSGDFDYGSGHLRLPHLTGTFAGTSVDGSLDLERSNSASGAKTTLGGTLKLDRLALSSLTGLALGPPQPVAAGAIWADGRFAAGLGAAPATSLSLAIGTLEISKNLLGQDATLHLETAPGIVALNEVSMKLGSSARLAGQLTLRRNGADAAMAGTMVLDGWPLRQPSLDGLAGVKLDFAATGTSASALAGGLAGSGQMTLKAGRVPGADKAAIARLLALSDLGKLTYEEGELRRTVGRELDRGAYDLGDQNFDLSLAAGTLRLAPVAENGPMKLAVDLRHFSLDQRLMLAETEMPKEWPGALPKMEVSFKGSAGAPVRDFDAGALFNDLTARAIARDSARIAALEADIRERAAFNRRSKALKQMRQSEIDLQNFLAAEAKRAAEEAKRAADEEAKRAAEEEKRRVIEAARAERERRAAEEAAKRNPPPPAPANPGTGDNSVPLNIQPQLPLPETPALPPPGANLDP